MSAQFSFNTFHTVYVAFCITIVKYTIVCSSKLSVYLEDVKCVLENQNVIRSNNTTSTSAAANFNWNFLCVMHSAETASMIR